MVSADSWEGTSVQRTVQLLLRRGLTHAKDKAGRAFAAFPPRWYSSDDLWQQVWYVYCRLHLESLDVICCLRVN